MRVNWIVNGERNTKFFRRNVLARRSKARILDLKDNIGRWISDQGEIEDLVISYS